jgi:hypothetical protein
MVKGLGMPLDRDITEEVFLGALSNSSVAARMDYLNEACGGDASLRQRVDALLVAYHDESNFLKLPNADAALSSAAISEGPRLTIGRYKLLEEIGEGGFGGVFMAEQEQPVRRRVALKIIKAGMDISSNSSACKRSTRSRSVKQLPIGDTARPILFARSKANRRPPSFRCGVAEWGTAST